MAKESTIAAIDFNIHTIIVAGEAGGSIPSTRESIENLWGAKVVDFYGLSDIYGACAAACEAHDGLHIVEDQILVETVDPTTGEVLRRARRASWCTPPS